MVRLIAALSLLASLSLTAGCSTSPASTRDADPAFPDPSSWPPRLADTLPAPEIPDAVTNEGAFGVGTLYRLQVEPDTDWPGAGSLLIFRSQADDPTALAGGGRLTWDSHEWVLPPAATNLMVSVSERSDVQHAGTCFYLASLMGLSQTEQPLVHELLLRGWRVVVIWPSFATYNHAFYIFPDSENNQAAVRGLAAGADAYLAGTAYGVEAALLWLQQQSPDLQQHPVVLVGSSIGAIAVPTAAARLRSHTGSRLDAAVLIGGGAGLLAITAASPVMQGRFAVVGFTQPVEGSNHMRVRTPEPAEVDDILRRAQELSLLDPGATASSLLDIPVLQLHARYDRIVPARTGDALWERLGRPERWTYATGHTGLFLVLPFEADDIARWIQLATGATPSPPPLAP